MYDRYENTQLDRLGMQCYVLEEKQAILQFRTCKTAV